MRPVDNFRRSSHGLWQWTTGAEHQLLITTSFHWSKSLWNDQSSYIVYLFCSAIHNATVWVALTAGLAASLDIKALAPSNKAAATAYFCLFWYSVCTCVVHSMTVSFHPTSNDRIANLGEFWRGILTHITGSTLYLAVISQKPPKLR